MNDLIRQFNFRCILKFNTESDLWEAYLVEYDIYTHGYDINSVLLSIARHLVARLDIEVNEKKCSDWDHLTRLNVNKGDPAIELEWNKLNVLRSIKTFCTVPVSFTDSSYAPAAKERDALIVLDYIIRP